MTTFSQTHRGERVALWDSSRERWMPPLLLLQDPVPCEHGCCSALAIRGESGEPVKVHASNAAEVRIVPQPREADAYPDPDAAYKAALENRNDDETGTQ